MCGIWLYLAKKDTFDKDTILKSSNKLIARGPDRQIYNKLSFSNYDLYFNFYRLAIRDLSINGDQPFILKKDSRTIYLMCNGEIYNHEYLIMKYKLQNKLLSKSDCEVLIHLYAIYGFELLYKEIMSDEVDSEFAMIIIDYDETNNHIKILASRDMGGVRPLYEAYSYNEDGQIVSLCLGSELKSIPYIDKVNCSQFKPYSYKIFSLNYQNEMNQIIINEKIFNLRDIPITIYDVTEAKIKINRALRRAVYDRMASDRPIMFMLSGGLDSSLCAALGAEYAKNNNLGPIHTMCVGMEGGTDEAYAKMVSEHINSIHHHELCSEKDFLDTVPDVVSVVESYDITTVRASTGQLISARRIALTDSKVVIIGDYSDEITGGYNETKLAPSVDAFAERIYELVENITYFDSQRADRCIAGNGLEARTPFADNRFIRTYLSIDPLLRMPHNTIEKYLLRSAFSEINLLPEEVLWRPKEAFSDGVSSLKNSWYEILQRQTSLLYTETDIRNNSYLINKPYTSESLYFRKIFDTIYSDNVANIIPYFWLPKWGSYSDPSARTLIGIYKK
jgi:asparagine synthase (glutamine-hydrolysing)